MCVWGKILLIKPEVIGQSGCCSIISRHLLEIQYLITYICQRILFLEGIFWSVSVVCFRWKKHQTFIVNDSHMADSGNLFFCSETFQLA